MQTPSVNLEPASARLTPYIDNTNDCSLAPAPCSLLPRTCSLRPCSSVPSFLIVYTVLHIPDFAVQAILRTERIELGRPTALFADHSKKSLVIATNEAARASGVELQMTAPQAVARCPTLLIRTHRANVEADARAALIAVGFTLSPLIEDTAPGVCTIDLRGTDPRQHEASAAAAVAQLERLGFAATAGIGPAPLLALYAARAVRRDRDRPSASIESRPSKSTRHQSELQLGEAASPYPAPSTRDRPSPRTEPGAIAVVLTVAAGIAFLAPLPIAAADPTPAIARVLASWGVKTLGQLGAISRDDIGRRLGPAGLALWDRARGGAPRPLHPVTLPSTFAAAMDFEDEIETLEPLLFVLRRFLERLTLELRTTGHVAAALDLSLTLADDTKHERNFRLPDPTADIEILFRALYTHLESLRTEASITGVELRATPARPLVRQHGLFDTGLRDPHGFAEMLARVMAIVGSDRVGTPQNEDTHRPDAVKLVPPPPAIPAAAEPRLHPPLGLPLRRFRPPLPAQLELTAGKPTYLWTDRFNGAIAMVRGPWRSSGEWWQADRAWHRTEYDVALATGGLYRLVYVDRRWFIDGEYD